MASVSKSMSIKLTTKCLNLLEDLPNYVWLKLLIMDLLFTNVNTDDSNRSENMARYQSWTNTIMERLRHYVRTRAASEVPNRVDSDLDIEEDLVDEGLDHDEKDFDNNEDRDYTEALDPELHRFLFINSSDKQRKKLLQILTHPAIRPPLIQDLFGRKSWPHDMLDGIPYSTTGDEFPEKLGGYHAEVRPSSPSESSYLRAYNGRTAAGLITRVSDHVTKLKSSYSEIHGSRLARMGGKRSDFLWFHEEAARLEAEVRFRISFSLPDQAISSSYWRRWFCILALLESLDTVIYGTIEPGVLNVIDPQGWLFKHRSCLRLFFSLRPADMPAPLASGLNLAPPFRQPVGGTQPLDPTVKDVIRQICSTLLADSDTDSFSRSEYRDIQRILWYEGFYESIHKIQAFWKTIVPLQNTKQDRSISTKALFEDAWPLLCAVKDWAVQNRIETLLANGSTRLNACIIWADVMQIISKLPLEICNQWPLHRCRIFWNCHRRLILGKHVWSKVNPSDIVNSSLHFKDSDFAISEHEYLATQAVIKHAFYKCLHDQGLMTGTICPHERHVYTFEPVPCVVAHIATDYLASLGFAIHGAWIELGRVTRIWASSRSHLLQQSIWEMLSQPPNLHSVPDLRQYLSVLRPKPQASLPSKPPLPTYTMFCDYHCFGAMKEFEYNATFAQDQP